MEPGKGKSGGGKEAYTAGDIRRAIHQWAQRDESTGETISRALGNRVRRRRPRSPSPPPGDESALTAMDPQLRAGLAVSTGGVVLLTATLLSGASLFALAVIGAGAILSRRGIQRQGVLFLLPRSTQSLLTDTSLLEWLLQWGPQSLQDPTSRRALLALLDPSARVAVTRRGLFHLLPETAQTLLLPAPLAHVVAAPPTTPPRVRGRGVRTLNNNNVENDDNAVELLTPVDRQRGLAIGSAATTQAASPETEQVGDAPNVQAGGIQTPIHEQQEQLGHAAIDTGGLIEEDIEVYTPVHIANHNNTGHAHANMHAEHEHAVINVDAYDEPYLEPYPEDGENMTSPSVTDVIPQLAWAAAVESSRRIWRTFLEQVPVQRLVVVAGLASTAIGVQLRYSPRARAQARAALGALLLASMTGVAVTTGGLAVTQLILLGRARREDEIDNHQIHDAHDNRMRRERAGSTDTIQVPARLRQTFLARPSLVRVFSTAATLIAIGAAVKRAQQKKMLPKFPFR